MKTKTINQTNHQTNKENKQKTQRRKYKKMQLPIDRPRRLLCYGKRFARLNICGCMYVLYPISYPNLIPQFHNSVAEGMNKGHVFKALWWAQPHMGSYEQRKNIHIALNAVTYLRALHYCVQIWCRPLTMCTCTYMETRDVTHVSAASTSTHTCRCVCTSTFF